MAKYKIINGEGIIPNETTEIADNAFSWNYELKSITIPTSVTKIGNRAFNECWGLTSITIPNSVTKIGEGAFEGCRRLESITIPKSVTEIGEKAFDECLALTSIIVAEGNKVYDSRNNCNAIIETKTNRLIQGCANTFIPESVLVIENYAFEGYSQLASITIPNSVKKIGNWAFEGCTALTSITIPNSVTKIGYEAFYECKNLKEIILFQTDPSKIEVTERSGLQKAQITLYVPNEGVAAFQKNPFWSEFAAIKPITDDMIK
ncbi:MAG: leucine-rich repeat domain-containing protein [Sodaliphilus sp.]|nr:leucine-rich repeat domain-containing protein [Sodaliphilus sp.]